MTSLLIDDKEKIALTDWLLQREKVLLAELDTLTGLKRKLHNNIDSKNASETKTEAKAINSIDKEEKKDDFSSWVNTIKNELKNFSHPVPSGDIVKRLMNDHVLVQKGKRFITKAVTSKLWLLQERGEVIKSKENGKYVYSLKK